jgi:hypothetical protein
VPKTLIRDRNMSVPCKPTTVNLDFPSRQSSWSGLEVGGGECQLWKLGAASFCQFCVPRWAVLPTDGYHWHPPQH